MSPTQEGLPTELIDLILGNLVTYSSALRACSLVCREWVYPSRYYLLRGVSVDRTNISDWLAFRGQDNFARDIQPFIKRLSISCYGSYDSTKDTFETDFASATQGFTLHTLHISSHIIDFPRSLPSTLRVNTLKLNFSCSSLGALLHLLASCPSTTHLRLNVSGRSSGEVSLAIPETDSEPILPRMTRLTVNLDEVISQSLARYLIDKPTMHITDMTLVRLDDHDHGLSTAKNLISVFGRQLQTVCLDLGRYSHVRQRLTGWKAGESGITLLSQLECEVLLQCRERPIITQYSQH